MGRKSLDRDKSGRKNSDRPRKSLEKGGKNPKGASNTGSKSDIKKPLEKGEVNANPPAVRQSELIRTQQKQTCKGFGPYAVETKQAHTAILLLQSGEEKVRFTKLNL
jgi:hypothetical protein